jgi:mRNA interferase MazF
MSITFHPNPGTILICDFEGFKAPEIIKRRPCVVVSPRSRRRTGLCTIVPLSTTDPEHVESHHCKITITKKMPDQYPKQECWAKCDIIHTVSFERLNKPHQKDELGKRTYLDREISPEDLLKIRRCICAGIGIKLALDPVPAAAQD